MAVNSCWLDRRKPCARFSELRGLITRTTAAFVTYPAWGSTGAATARGRMNCSTALAKPSSSLEAVTQVACRCTSSLALPIAMLKPLRWNISTSFAPSPSVAICSSGIL